MPLWSSLVCFFCLPQTCSSSLRFRLLPAVFCNSALVLRRSWIRLRLEDQPGCYVPRETETVSGLLRNSTVPGIWCLEKESKRNCIIFLIDWTQRLNLFSWWYFYEKDVTYVYIRSSQRLFSHHPQKKKRKKKEKISFWFSKQNGSKLKWKKRDLW